MNDQPLPGGVAQVTPALAKFLARRKQPQPVNQHQPNN